MTTVALKPATMAQALTRALRDAMTGGFRFPYGANVYASRISDYYWWHNQRPLPTWYAFWEVNAILLRPQ